MWYSPAADSSDINESRISWQLEYKALDEWGLDFVHLLGGGGGKLHLQGLLWGLAYIRLLQEATKKRNSN